MKRTLLLIASLIFFTGLSAQSLILKDVSGNDITGLTVGVPCPNNEVYASFKVHVLNNASTAKNVKVRKVEINQLEGVSDLTICWTECYAPFVFESPVAITAEPGTVITNFEGDINYLAGTNGAFKAKFVFFDADNPTDSSFVIAEYNLGPLGEKENIFSKAKVSNAYPNPASNMVYVDYQLPSNVTGAKLKISNLLGTTVTQVELTEREGKAGINVNNLKNGVYFYTLMVNNSAAVTRKFVINR